METVIMGLLGANALAAFALGIAVFLDALATFRSGKTR